MLTAEIPLDRMFVFVALDTLEMVAIVQVLLFPFILFDLRLKTKTERKQNKTKQLADTLTLQKYVVCT